MTIYKGTITALVTPFNEENELDVVGLKQIVKWQVENNVDGIIVSGTTGESPNLSEDEFIELILNSKKITKDKIPLIAGVGTSSTAKTIKQAKLAEETGADGLLVIVPYYNKPTQRGIIEHFKAINDAVSIPIMLYNAPGRVIVNMTTSTIQTIFEECANVVGIKECPSDVLRFGELAKISPNFDVLTGDDPVLLPARTLGAKGVVSVISNILPDVVVALNKACDTQDYEKALEIHNNLANIISLMFVETNPIPVKYAMSVLALCKNKLRLPLVPLSEEHQTKIKEELRKFYDIK